LAIIVSDADLRHTVEVNVQCGGSIKKTAKTLGMSRSCVRNRLALAVERGIVAKQPHRPERDELYYQARINQLERELGQIRKHNLTTEDVRRFIYRLGDTTPEDPGWLVSDKSKGGHHVNIGVPQIPLTDIHHGEVVEAKEIMGLNKFNSEICEARIRLWAERTIDLLTNHIHGEYPGVVIPFLGDFHSGLIHEELTATNEEPIFVSLHRLFGILTWVIKQFADQFGRVFIPAVPGNHGRLRPGKPWIKHYAVNNFDWHLYCLLEKWFESDDRVRFKVSSSQDVNWSVYGWRYRGTHGAQFRGGDGIIGALGPVCVAPDTPILKTDLSYIRAGDLKVGDELIGFDENAAPGERRRFRPSTVTECRRLELECLEIETSNGLKTVASEDHPWLLRVGNGHEWRATKGLNLGNKIMSLGRPWAKEDTWEAGYLAGVLDAEKSSILWNGRSVQIASDVEVVGIRRIGKREVAGFTTSTQTFIANGMLTHNTRGDVRKRVQASDAMRDSRLDIGYDTLVLGHFHTTILSRRLMVCGSIKGFDEFAFQNNLPYELPQQAMWLHHPRRGPTFTMPIHCDDGISKADQGMAWVSWQV
jgi:hypothetical protein